MGKTSEADFKKAFNKKSDKFQSAFDELENKVDEITKLGGKIDRFQAILDKRNGDIQKLANNQITYKEAYKNLKDTVSVLDLALKGAKAEAEFSAVKVQPHGMQPIKFYTGSIPGFGDLPKDRQAKVQQEILVKIENGKKKFDELSKKDFDPATATPPSDQDLADFMWYIKAMAENKTNEPSAKGAVTLPDPDNKIRKFFSRAPGMYYRRSSHLKEQAEDKFKNEDGTKTPRGFDFYEGSADDTSKLLPYGMNAVLLQSVETTGGAQLYVKMETESARLSPEAKVKGDEMAEKRRDWKKEDVGRTVKHGANLVFPEKDKTGLSAFRENTPVEDIKAYDSLLKGLEGIDMLASTILEQGYTAPPKNNAAMKKIKGEENKEEKAVDAGNRMRIFQMLKNIDTALGHQQVSQLVKAQLLEERKKLVAKYPDGDNRFGGEIVLSTNDLHAKDDPNAKPKDEPKVGLDDDVPQEKTKKSKKAKSKGDKYVELEDEV